MIAERPWRVIRKFVDLVDSFLMPQTLASALALFLLCAAVPAAMLWMLTDTLNTTLGS